MNKRIQEIAEQATKDKWKLNRYMGDPVFDGREIDTEKFAELIVQDCISQIAMIGVSNCDDPDVVWTVDKAIQNIREHFGVSPRKEAILPDEENECHPCPYNIEINDDYDTLCSCNEEETEQCRMAI